jgi:hypothetical protein
MKKLKATDMKYHWLWDRISHKWFQHYWAPGNKYKGNYVTKHHAPVHHEAMRLTFLTSIATLQALCNRVSNLLPAARVCQTYTQGYYQGIYSKYMMLHTFTGCMAD